MTTAACACCDRRYCAVAEASLAFLTLSAYRAIMVSVGDVYAPLIVGCFYLVAGLIAALVAQMRRR